MNRGCFGGDSDWIDCETALPLLMLGHIVNHCCLGVESDQIDCETALPQLVLRYVVNQG